MREELKIIGAASALILVILCAAVWANEHDARVRAEAAAQASQTAARDAEATIQQLEAQDAARQAQAAATIDAMQKLASRVQTPQQIAQWLPKQLPLPQPITVNVPAATAANPEPPATAEIPQVDLTPLRDIVESCKECSVKLAASEADAESKAAQLKAAGEELSAISAERDAWKRAAKGTFWSRAKSALKWAAIGGAAAGAALCGSGHCK